MITIYVLQSLKSGKLYVGITKELKRRLKEHNLGKSTFTSAHMPWVVVYTESADDYPTARVREKYLKSNAGKKYIQKMLKDHDITGSLPA